MSFDLTEYYLRVAQYVLTGRVLFGYSDTLKFQNQCVFLKFGLLASVLFKDQNVSQPVQICSQSKFDKLFI